MPIVDSVTGEITKQLNAEDIAEISQQMRAYALIAIHAAQSGHPGGSLSAMDLIATLFFRKMKIDPNNPDWEERDRFILSKGHASPALFSAFAFAGYIEKEELLTFRQYNTRLQGHPCCTELPVLEISTGSLGQGLGAAIGAALALKLDNCSARVYCLMGCGEQQEGSIWEAAMSAAHYKVDNLVGIVDFNDLQIDGSTRDIMNIEPLVDKYRAFGWETIEIDGHDIDQIISALDKADTIVGKPTVIIARTVKGKNVSFMENLAKWHGAPTKTVEDLLKALDELGQTDIPVKELLDLASQSRRKIEEDVNNSMPKFSKDYWWNNGDVMQVDKTATRDGFGNAIEQIGEDERIVALCADLKGSTKISMFDAKHPDRANRFFQTGVAEQNMISLAAGLASQGKIAVPSSFDVFASGRCYDQIRQSVCYSNMNVKIAASHGGLTVGEDGATHQGLESLSLMSVLPNMRVFAPCDAIETKRLAEIALMEIEGPCYIRYGREATPVVTTPDTPLKFGVANIYRYRKEEKNFLDAFEICLSNDYDNEDEDLTIIACGIMVPESMRAAYILKEEFGIEVRVINMHTVKPIDEEAIVAAANDTCAILTVEEHQKGGFGNVVAGIASTKKHPNNPFVMDMIGVEDRFGESAPGWILLKAYGLTAESIADRAKKLLERKKG